MFSSQHCAPSSPPQHYFHTLLIRQTSARASSRHLADPPPPTPPAICVLRPCRCTNVCFQTQAINASGSCYMNRLTRPVYDCIISGESGSLDYGTSRARAMERRRNIQCARFALSAATRRIFAPSILQAHMLSERRLAHTYTI